MSKNRKTLLTFLIVAFAVSSLITLILYVSGVGINAVYQTSSGGHATGTWSTATLVFGGEDSLQSIGVSGGLVVGFVLAILAFILAVLALIGSYVKPLEKAKPALTIAGAIALLSSGILLINIKNLAVDGKGKALFVNSVYSSVYTSITPGAAPIVGFVFALLGFLSAVTTAVMLLRSK